MPDIDTDQVADTLADAGAAFIADADAGTRNAVEEPDGQTSDAGSDDSTESSDGLKDNQAGGLKREDLKTQLEQSERSRREMQSLHDRHFNEQQSKIAKLEGMYEAITRTGIRGEADPQLAANNQAEFDKKWRAEIEENPSKAIDFVRGVMADVESIVNQRVDDRLKGVESQVVELNPVYRENKDVIDTLMESGLDRKSAMIAAIKLGEKKQLVRQPGKVQAPGIANANGRVAPSKQATPKPLNADPVLREVWRGMGLSEKEQAEIALEAAQG